MAHPYDNSIIESARNVVLETAWGKIHNSYLFTNFPASLAKTRRKLRHNVYFRLSVFKSNLTNSYESTKQTQLSPNMVQLTTMNQWQFKPLRFHQILHYHYNKTNFLYFGVILEDICRMQNELYQPNLLTKYLVNTFI